MQKRLIHIIVVGAALLVLLGAGGAVLLGATREDSEDENTRAQVVGAGRGNSLPSNGMSLPISATVMLTPVAPTPAQPTTVPTLEFVPIPTVPIEPSATVQSVEAVAPAEPPPAAEPEPPTPVVVPEIPPPPPTPVPVTPDTRPLVEAFAAPTDVPVPAAQPERVGGPVKVVNNHDGPRWVTLQIGHLRSENFPDELEHLRNNTGAFAGGVSEVSLNQAVAQRTARFLVERGYNVDILDATVPVDYVTDLFLAIHADGNDSTVARGFKAVTPWNAPPATETFVGFLYEEYGKATGLPSDPRSSVGMANYYAFNPWEYRHAVHPSVPATLLEMGFVTNPFEREFMRTQTDKIGWGIANAVDRYFRSGAAGATPSPYPTFTPTVTPTFTPSHTPTQTPTFTPTPTPTSTPTETPTLVPTELADAATATAALTTPSPTLPPSATPPRTATPRPPPTSPTAIPTATPFQGIITKDGRWLPQLSPHVRGSVPQPGSSGPPVMLDEDVEDFVMTANGRERIQIWQQFYMPDIGRSVWKKGPTRPLRH